MTNLKRKKPATAMDARQFHDGTAQCFAEARDVDGILAYVLITVDPDGTVRLTYSSTYQLAQIKGLDLALQSLLSDVQLKSKKKVTVKK